MKICRTCKNELPFTYFYKKKVNRDGYAHYCKACSNQYVKEWGKRNKDKLYGYNQTYLSKNKDKRAAYVKSWEAANPEKVLAKAAKRRASKKSATPKWADTAKIEAVYAMAKWLEFLVPGQKYHVDHNVPLQSKVVCGLHVHQNLVIRRAEDNFRKNNSFTVE